MISSHLIDRYLTRYPSLSGLIYFALVVVFCLTTLFSLTDIVDRYRTRNASLEILDRLDGRAHISSIEPSGTKDSWPPGSPFLDGQTVTVASAALLQRIIDIITHAGGTVVSSEIEPQTAQSKDGYVTAIANCELEQAALQQVLYDIEAGLPFLFIDQLVVQTPALPGEGGRMRVLLGVSGLWPGVK
jgi:general secretion pathway protein M